MFQVWHRMPCSAKLAPPCSRPPRPSSHSDCCRGRRTPAPSAPHLDDVRVVQAEPVRDFINNALHLVVREAIGVCLDLAPRNIDALLLVKPLEHHLEAAGADILLVA